MRSQEVNWEQYFQHIKPVCPWSGAALKKGELKITEGALYPALHKLEADGLLDVEVAKVGNRLRKYYKLTESGSKETANKLEEMQEFLKTMQQLVNPKFSLE